MMSKKKIITSALPYPNGPLHLGHIAWVYLPADIYYRYCKSINEDVIHVCGTDDHGVALEIASEKYGKPVSELVEEYRISYKEGMEKMGIVFTIFHGTNTVQHEEIAHDFFRKLYNQWLLEERTIHQMYCNKCRKFLPDRYIVWVCPKCKTPWATGEQCEACGSMIDPETLLEPYCKTCHGNDLELKESKHLFFLLDLFQNDLKQRLETKNDRKPNVISTALGKRIKDSLQPRCYTRDTWCGIKVPLAWFEDKTIYVRFEAPLWYISITKKYFDELGAPDRFDEFWRNSETELIEFIWKDNIVFHTIIWPALLMAYNNWATGITSWVVGWTHTENQEPRTNNYIIPTNVPANEFLNLEGKKFSTSRGRGVWLSDIVNNYHPDYIRYYLTSIMPQTQDSNFQRKEFQDKCNNLCDSLGNLFSRVTSLITRYYGGQFELFGDINDYIIWSDNLIKDHILWFVWQVPVYRDKILWHLQRFEFREGLSTLMDRFGVANKFINDTKPWELIKTDSPWAQKILSVLGWYFVVIAVVMRPYLPFTSDTIIQWLVLGSHSNIINSIQTIWNFGVERQYKTLEAKPDHLFVKITDEQITQEMEKLEVGN